MFNARKLFTAAALALCALAPTAVSAAPNEILFLATSQEDNWGHIENAYNAFSSAVGGSITASGNIARLRTGGAINQRFNEVSGGGVVVIMAGKTPIHSDHITRFKQEMESRPDLTFMIFVNGNQSGFNSGNPEKFRQIVADNTGWPLEIKRLPNAQGFSSPVNSESSYKGSFPASIKGHLYTAIDGAPFDNVLYRKPDFLTNNGGNPDTADKALLRSDPYGAYGLFVPQQQFNGGKGACVLLFNDTNMWDGRNNPNATLAKSLIAGAKANCNATPPTPAPQPKVLFLSTKEKTWEEGNASGDYTKIGDYMINDTFYNFRRVVGPQNITDKRGALSGGISAADLDGYDVIIVQSMYNPINGGAFSVIKDKMNDLPDTTFLVFSDACLDCSQTQNVKQFESSLRDATGWPLDITWLKDSNYFESPLNTGSPYSSPFAANLSKLAGHIYGAISCVPEENILYKKTLTFNPMPSAATQAEHKKVPDPAAYAILIPQNQYNDGKGSCTFFVTDSNVFDAQTLQTLHPEDGHQDHQAQQIHIAETLLAQSKNAYNDANNPGAMCYQTRKKPELVKAADGTCKLKATPGGGAAAVPTTGWPALLGLSVLLPLLARRRRRT